MALTDDQFRLLTESFARLVPASEEAAVLFYKRLWEIAPETKVLFKTDDVAEQGMKIMQMLGVTIRSLNDASTVTPLLHELGKRHIDYGVTREQYALVGDALLWMIEQCLREDFTPEVRAAWIAGYDLMTSMAISAYE